MRQEISAEDVRSKLKNKKKELFMSYNLEDLAFAIVTNEIIDQTVVEGKDTVIGKYTKLTIIVNFSKPTGWKFYSLQNELTDLLKADIWLVTKHKITKEKYIIEHADIYEEI